MQVTVNKNVVIHCDKSEYVDLMKALEHYVVVENKGYIQKLNMGFSVRDEPQWYSLADIKIDDEDVYITTPVGLWDYISHLFEEKDVINYRNVTEADLLYSRVTAHNYKILYDYQLDAVKAMCQYSNGILKAKPGSGKTLMGEVLGLCKGDSFLFINDRIDLCKQALKTAVKYLHLKEEDCGLLQGDNEVIKKYTFTTIQKLHKVLNEGFNNKSLTLRHFDTIIIDECHHAVGSYNNYKSYFQALTELTYHNLYGLTATDERVDGNEYMVYALIGPVRYEVEGVTKTLKATVKNKHTYISTSQETYMSFLNQYTQKTMPHKVNNYLLYHEDFVERCKKEILPLISNYKKLLIVSPLVDGAKMWSNLLEQEGVDNFLVYGAIKKRERLYTDKVIVATLDLVKEGFDVPDLECIVVVSRPIHKQVKTQVVGRCERFIEGKKEPYALFLIPHIKKDWVDNKPWSEVNLNEL